MKLIFVIFVLLYILNICEFSFAWDNYELEVFDVVEEVNQNFYELLGVPKDADSSEIKKAFRRLSLQLHPDKNPAENADVQFRNLVAVYDVLKDANKRKCYENVLVNGLPNWRSAVYYYRHVRKMGLMEMSIILFILITIGQYLVAWAAYFEKRYTIHEQVLGSKFIKKQKKNRKGKMDIPDLAEILDSIPAPSIWNTLPFQLPKWIVGSIIAIPSTICAINAILEERKRRKKQEEEEALLNENEEPEPEPLPRGPRRRRAGFTPQEKNNVSEYCQKNEDQPSEVDEKPVLSGGLWTDDDLLELIRLVKKYPSGTSERWEKIAKFMNRSVSEVTHMAKKIKEEGLKPGQVQETNVADDQKKVKTRKTVANASEWSQEQQKALEVALTKYPKGMPGDRWEKISNCIEGKNKVECQARYRELVEIVKNKQTN